VLKVNNTLIDVDNPTITLKAGQRPSGTMLFELEFGCHLREREIATWLAN
jgi:hypothetical protein